MVRRMIEKRSHVPMRSCCGCGQRDEQAALLRLAIESEGRLVPDAKRRHGGRGAYLHHRITCWDRFVKGKAYLRSLRRNVDRRERARIITLVRAEDAASAGRPAH